MSASDDKTVRVWRVEEDGSVESLTLKGHSRWVYNASFSIDNGVITVVSASGDNTARVWRVEEDGSVESRKLKIHRK